MKNERWGAIEELFHAARALQGEDQASFLDRKCGADGTLRRKVEALLRGDEKAEGILNGAALDTVAAHMVSDLGHQPMTGRSIGGYHLQTLLGAGGMGEVYRSHDTKLGRDVAIKILSPAFANDPDRLARFSREARVLAALNHPNIDAIYGLEEAEGIRFLVLELVEGKTLAEKLAQVSGGTGLPLRSAVGIARQIADALEAAHEKGIVHRDLKPANIKITPDGVVKVLDFGLAKPVDGDGSMPELTNVSVATERGTREGVVMGTAAYMSPEQARGLTVDKRTDIWAFGCVLYEMLTARVTFAGDTISDTIAKILEREADWSALPATTPAHIRRLLLRCLAKDPKQRWRDIGDVRIEIDATTHEVLPGGPEIAVAPARTYATWLPWVALVALAVGAGVWEVRRPPATIENPLEHATFSRLTDWESTEYSAELSKDGKFVVFLADKAGEFDLWQTQVGTGNFFNLTDDLPALDAPGVIGIRNFGFSGDGSEVWLSPGEARATNPTGDAALKTEAKLLIPLMGGTARSFLGESAEAPSWSREGARLAFFTNGGGDPLFVAEGTGTDARKFLEPGGHNHNLVWSPDDQWIYFAHGSDPTSRMEIWRVHPSGESRERLTEQNWVSFLAPLDDRTLLYIARAEDQSGPWLWTLDLASKVKRRATLGPDEYRSVAASADGRRVVTTVANPSVSLWRVPVRDDGFAEERDVQPYPMPALRPMARALAPRFSKTSLFYLSSRGTGDELWRVLDGKASEVSRGTALFEPAVVSPDGRLVAVVIRREGERHLEIMSADGTNSRTLAPSIVIQGAAGQGAAAWSPDSTWIVAGGSDASAQKGLFKIPVDGGEPSLIKKGQGTNPVWSPDGNLIVYSSPLVAGQATFLGMRPDGTPVELPPMRARQGAYRFLPDGKSLVFLTTNESVDFWLLDLATKMTRQLTRLNNKGKLQTFDLTPDGKQIVFDRTVENSHIVLIDLPR